MRWKLFWRRAGWRFRPARPRKRNKRRFRMVKIIPILVVLLVAYLWMGAKIRPLLMQVADAQVRYLATKLINETVSAEMAREEMAYDNLVYFEKDGEGKITALKTDMFKINQFKQSITAAISEAIRDVPPSELHIPLGNLLKSELFSGRGPNIPVKIVPVGAATASFSNRFEAAGINQTRHQVLIDVEVDIGILLPGSDSSTLVSTQVNVAETIIVGLVPDSFVSMRDGVPVDMG